MNRRKTLLSLLTIASLLAIQAAQACCEQVTDLRAEKWKVTTVKTVGSGAIQQFGDDTTIGSFADLIGRRIATAKNSSSFDRVALKTADVRLTLTAGRINEDAVRAAQQSVPRGGLIAVPIAALLSSFSKDKTASAVFCVAINGKNYLGNDARLFRFGAENQLKDSLEAALSKLVEAVESEKETQSVACEPGWEGGQPAL